MSNWQRYRDLRNLRRQLRESRTRNLSIGEWRAGELLDEYAYRPQDRWSATPAEIERALRDPHPRLRAAWEESGRVRQARDAARPALLAEDRAVARLKREQPHKDAVRRLYARTAPPRGTTRTEAKAVARIMLAVAEKPSIVPWVLPVAAPARSAPVRVDPRAILRELRTPRWARYAALVTQAWKRQPASVIARFVLEQIIFEVAGMQFPAPALVPVAEPYPNPADGWQLTGSCSASLPVTNVIASTSLAGSAYQVGGALARNANNCLAGQTATDTDFWPRAIPNNWRGFVLSNRYPITGGFFRHRVMRTYWRPAAGATSVITHQPGLAATPQLPHQLPRPGGAPRLAAEPGRTPLTGRGESPGQRPGGRPPVPPQARPSGHRFEPPPPGGKQRKFNIRNQAVLSPILAALEGVSESADTVAAVYEALPKCRLRSEFRRLGRQPTPGEKAHAVWKHFSEINVPLAVFNLLVQRVEDQLDGRVMSSLGGGTVSQNLDFHVFGAQSRVGGRIASGGMRDDFGELGYHGGGSAADAAKDILGSAVDYLAGEPMPDTVSAARRALRRLDQPCN